MVSGVPVLLGTFKPSRIFHEYHGSDQSRLYQQATSLPSLLKVFGNGSIIKRRYLYLLVSSILISITIAFVQQDLPILDNYKIGAIHIVFPHLIDEHRNHERLLLLSIWGGHSYLSFLLRVFRDSTDSVGTLLIAVQAVKVVVDNNKTGQTLNYVFSFHVFSPL